MLRLSALRIIGILSLIASPPDAPETKAQLIALLIGLGALATLLDAKNDDGGKGKYLLAQEADALLLLGITFLLASSPPLGKAVVILGLVRPTVALSMNWDAPGATRMPWSLSIRITSILALILLAIPLIPGFPEEWRLACIGLSTLTWGLTYGQWIKLALLKARSSGDGHAKG